MKASVDIPFEILKEAMDLIEKRKGTCQFLPAARFIMTDWDNEFRFDTLVCSRKMGGKRTGVGAQYCKNCLKSEGSP